jgi:hypothetical protein
MGLGSEIRDQKKPIPDPGFGFRAKKKPDLGSGSATQNFFVTFKIFSLLREIYGNKKS